MNQEKIGKYIKELRTNKGISQKDLGEKLHITRQAISNWENGKTLPDPDVLVALSKFFEVSINDILSGGEKEDLEKVALELVRENNKKNIQIKRSIFISSVIITSLLIFFLGYYFINNYNSINVFRASGNSKSFVIRDGIIISTSKNIYFKLGNLELKNKNNEINVVHIKLYTKNKKKENVIFESDLNDRLLINSSGYDTFHRKHLNKNNIYLEITYNDNEKETIKLELKEDFKNDYIMTIDDGSIIRNKLSEENENMIQYLFSQEEKEYELKKQVRNDNFERLQYKPEIKEENNNYVEEEQPPINSNEEVKEPEMPTPSLEEEPNEENEEKKEENQLIDYDEIINIINTYGIEETNYFYLDYELEDGTYISISFMNGQLKIESYSADFTEIENYSYQKSFINYEQMINYITAKKYLINIFDENSEEEKEIIDRMNNYLLLVYQEIEEEQF